MVEIKPLCRGCYSQSGVSQVLYPSAEGLYICPKNPLHRYKKDADGMMVTITDSI